MSGAVSQLMEPVIWEEVKYRGRKSVSLSVVLKGSCWAESKLCITLKSY